MNMKKSVRKVKRSIRKATGHESILKDTKDTLLDAKDEATTAARKAKYKIQEK